MGIMGIMGIMRGELCSLQKEVLEFTFEIGGEEFLADGIADFIHSPESATVEFFLRGMNLSVVAGAVDIDQFALPTAVEDVLPDMLGREIGDAQLFADFPTECFFGCLAIIQMTAYGRIPFPGLDILPFRTALQIDFSATVKDMQMDYGMQQPRTIVAFTTRGLTYDVSRIIDYRENLFTIIFHWNLKSMCI